MNAPQLNRAWLNRQLQEDFRLFLFYAFMELHGGKPLKANWHIDAMCHALEASTQIEGDRLLITIGPWNLVFILSDDHARWGMAAYGYPEVRTPRLDRLAAEGALVENAFATCPICTPSRLNVYTGMESVQIGTLNDVIGPPGQEAIPYGAPSWARELQKAGYHTGFVGKWHLGSEPERSPTRYGWDYFFGFRAGGNASQNPMLARGEGAHEQHQGWTDNLLVDDAIDYLRQVAGSPFCLSLNLRGPHLPHVPQPQEDLEAVRDIEPIAPDLGDAGIIGMTVPGSGEAIRRFVSQQRRDYYAGIHNVDRNVGRIVDALQSLGLSERTVVVYTSDNGYLLGERGLFNKGAAAPVQYDMFADKRELWAINMWDLAIRVPMAIRWPGVIAPGTRIDALLAMYDLFPTFLGMLGVALPAEPDFPGRDASGVLRGEAAPWRDVIFGQYTSDRIGNLELLRMARTHRWKLVKYYLNPAASKLYDLQNDPGELKNLYYAPGAPPDDPDGATYAAIRDGLQEQLRGWQVSIGDPALELEHAYDASQSRALERWRKTS